MVCFMRLITAFPKIVVVSSLLLPCVVSFFLSFLNPHISAPNPKTSQSTLIHRIHPKLLLSTGEEKNRHRLESSQLWMLSAIYRNGNGALY
jgi:hypothetical protein